MLKPRFIIFLVFISIICNAQTKTDSLRKLIDKAEGEQKIDLMWSLGSELSQSTDNTDEYFDFADKMYKLADSLNYNKGRCYGLLQKSLARSLANSWPNAIMYNQQALKIAEEIEETSLIFRVLEQMQDLYLRTSTFDSAIIYNDIAMKLAVSEKDTSAYLMQLVRKIRTNMFAGKNKLNAPLIEELNKRLSAYNGKTHDPELINMTIATYYYFSGDYHNAMKTFKLILKYHQNTTDYQRLSVINSKIGNCYYFLHKTDSAIFYANESIKCKPADIDRRGTAMAYNNLGGIYQSRDEFKKALDNFFKSIEIKNQLNDSVGVARTNMNISTIYRAMGNHKKAIEYNRKALPIFYRKNLNSSIAYALNNLGNSYMELIFPDSAIYYFRRALKIRKELQIASGIASTSNNIGQYYRSVNKLDSAIYYHQLALESNTNNNDTLEIALSMGFLGSCFFDLGQYSKAIATYIAAIPELKKERSYDDLADIYKNLAASYYQTGKYKSSYDALINHQQIQDSIFNEEKIKTIAEMQEKYDSELKDKENLALQQKLELTRSNAKLTRTQNWMLLISLVLVVLASISAGHYFRNKRRSDRLKLQLAKQENENRKLEEKRLSDKLFAEKEINKLQKEKLEKSREKLHSTSLQIVKQNQRFQTLKLAIKESKWSGDQDKKTAKELLIYIDQSIDCEMKWVQFRNEFEESYPGFMDALLEKYDTLTDRELQLLALVRTNLTSRQIADIICIEEDSVKKSRSRIIKKMGIELETTLYDFLCTI
jgi:tetratricopeptide (TPR) repeat protein